MDTTKKTTAVKLKNPLKKGGFLCRNKYLFLTFFITFVIMFLAYAVKNIAPFNAIIPDFMKPLLEKLGLMGANEPNGDRMSLVIDQYHQYFPFFRELHEKVTTGGSLLYTWEGGLGTNFISLIAYYAMSPIYLLSLFVPASKLTQFMAVAVVLKLSFASSTMFVYLRSMFKKENFVTVLFAAGYGLCAYAIGYSWCIMWLDVLIFLPLCLLGLNKLIDEGKFTLYVISLGLMMLTNYYIGVMMCLFIALYYPVLYFSRPEKRGAKHCLQTTLKVIGFSVLGCLLASIVIVPTYLSMQNVYYMGAGFNRDSKAYQTLFETLGNLLPGSTVTHRGGLPNMFAGSVVLVFAILFFFNKKISTHKKVGYGLLLTFLLVSFNWNVLDFIWHGLHFPNELPFRYSFVFSFLLIDMAYHAFMNIDEFTGKQIGGVAAGSFAFVVLAEILTPKRIGHLGIYICIGVFAIIFLLITLYKSKRLKNSLCFLLIGLFGFGELTVYTIIGIDSIGSTSRTSYYQYADDVEAMINSVEEKDKGFYRMETFNDKLVNDPAFYGYKGVSLFSSSFNTNLGVYLYSLGASAPTGANRLTYKYSTPLLNSLYNVKYLMARGDEMPYAADFNHIGTFGESNLYENKYPLSLGFMVKSGFSSYNPKKTKNVFENQQRFINEVTNLDLSYFNIIENPVITLNDGTYTEDGNAVKVEGTEGKATLYLEYTVPKAQNVYIAVYANNLENFRAGVGAKPLTSFGSRDVRSVIGLGFAEAGETVSVELHIKEKMSTKATVKVAGIDMENWETAYAALSDEMLNVTDYTDTKVKGNITVKADGLMMTSIPYEKGWSAKVDGKKVSVTPINNAFCGLALTEGTHEIEFSYFPEGLATGIVLTVLSIGALVALIVLRKKKIKVTAPKENEAETVTELESPEEKTEEAPTLSEKETPEEKTEPEPSEEEAEETAETEEEKPEE